MQQPPRTFSSPIDFQALGERLRAYRIGASLQAEDVAEQLGVSRAVVYRMEKGEIVKIETLERLAQLLGTSMASLLDVEVEYYPTVTGFLERMRQIEQGADRIISHFEPISLLLTSDDYLQDLRVMLLESSPPPVMGKSAQAGSAAHRAGVEQILQLLQERKAFFAQRRPNIVSLIGLRELERFVYTGLVGRLDLPEALRAQRVQAARREVRWIADLMASQPMNVQIGLVDDAMPAATFQLLQGAGRSVLALSPFRFGELPNVRNGIATVTASPEAVGLYESMMERLWKSAYKGQAGAQHLRKLLDRL
ncbi:Helix-turn-helix domain-containing protein [Polaromonas sp. OV174]|nr:helix-turn-helix transcriptional regulator [Polaromonas sp. OV174]SFC19698.1 Helix-turn-helix domain-containing protein [Polaromonas sp. OV174]